MQKLMNSRKEEREQGFTLVEMVVTVSIILILSLIAVMSFSDQRKSSVDSSVENDIKVAALKVETWKITNPNGAPSDSIIANDYSEKDTVLTLINIDTTTYEIRGFNPRGKKYSEAPGFVYHSVDDRI